MEMASWKQSFKVSYEKSLATYVTLPDSPVKDSTDISEDAISEGSENDLCSEVIPEQNRHSSLPPIELNYHLKIKKAAVRSSDCNTESEEKEYELLPHFSLLHNPENYERQQQHISKDMLCTVVKGMELSSKMSETDHFEDLSVENILEDLSEDNIELKCIGLLTFAKKFYLSEKFRSQLDEAEVLSAMLKTLPDVLSFNNFAFCYAVLLCVLSHYPKDKANQELVELLLVKFLKSTTNRRKSDAACLSSSDIGGYEMESLPKNVMEKSIELCRLMSMCDDWELQGINITFLNCVSVKKIFGHSTEGGQRSNNTDILCCVMDKIHEYVQQLSSKKQQGCIAESNDYLINLKMIWKCLQALEMASLFHPENQKYLVSCQNSAISRHSNRILGFCMKYLYYDSLPQSLNAQMSDSDTNQKEKLQFYLKSCLISILKVLLNISHNCKEAVIKLGTIDGLMEKLLMCILTIGSPKTEEQFAVIILCLELLINLIEPCWANHKTFAILCLKKFPSSVDSNIHAVEHLIEILAEVLNEISLLEKFNNEATKGVEDSSRADETVKNSDDAKAECVFIVAGKHMEQHMVCAYICILLGFFADIKRTFRDLVHEKMPRGTIEQAILVSKRFLRFVALTEDTGQNSIRSLNVMMTTLQSIHDGR